MYRTPLVSWGGGGYLLLLGGADCLTFPSKGGDGDTLLQHGSLSGEPSPLPQFYSTVFYSAILLLCNAYLPGGFSSRR